MAAQMTPNPKYKPPTKGHTVNDSPTQEAVEEEVKPEPRSLYKIGMDLNAIDDIMQGLGGDVSDEEVDQVITAWMTENQDRLGDKIDGYCNMIEFFMDRATRRNERAKQMAALAKSDITHSKRLIDRILEFMVTHSIEKIETDVRKVTTPNVGGKQVLLLDKGVIVENYWASHQKRTEVIRPDNDAIRADIEVGKEVPYAEILPRGKRLSIK